MALVAANDLEQPLGARLGGAERREARVLVGNHVTQGGWVRSRSWN